MWWFNTAMAKDYPLVGRRSGTHPHTTTNGVNSRGFLWSNGTHTTIVVPGERTDTVAHDINDRGDIVIPADGTVIRQPETACGCRLAPAGRRRRWPACRWHRPSDLRDEGVGEARDQCSANRTIGVEGRIEDRDLDADDGAGADRGAE